MAQHKCPQCDHAFIVPDWLDTQLKCPKCGWGMGQISSHGRVSHASRFQDLVRRLIELSSALITKMGIGSLATPGIVISKDFVKRLFSPWSRKQIALTGGGLLAVTFVVALYLGATRRTDGGRQEAAVEIPQTTTYVPIETKHPIDRPLFSRGEEIYDDTLRSTVWIIVKPSDADGASGTGCLIDAKRGHVLTNMHVVEGSSTAFVFLPSFDDDDNPIGDRSHYIKNEKPFLGKVIRTDRLRDLALIELETAPEAARPFKLAARSVKPGQNVYTVGNPGASGSLWVFTSGTVRSVYQGDFISEGHQITAKVVETQNPTNPGDSGGPVVNDERELVAVTQSYSLDGRLVSICIDISEIKAFLNRP